jgi:predicted DNA-binding protein
MSDKLLIKEKEEVYSDGTFKFRLAPELKKRFQTLAKKKGMTTAEFNRFLIMRELEKEPM